MQKSLEQGDQKLFVVKGFGLLMVARYTNESIVDWLRHEAQAKSSLIQYQPNEAEGIDISQHFVLEQLFQSITSQHHG